MCLNTTSPYTAPLQSWFSSCSTSNASSTSALPLTSEFWLQFPDFNPNPKAAFLEEFAKLAKQQGWSRTEKCNQRVAAYSAEISFHWNGFTELDSWQALCVEVGVAAGDCVPSSITKCKKVGVFLLLISLDTLLILRVVY
jgi:hypothetical protein